MSKTMPKSAPPSTLQRLFLLIFLLTCYSSRGDVFDTCFYRQDCQDVDCGGGGNIVNPLDLIAPLGTPLLNGVMEPGYAQYHRSMSLAADAILGTPPGPSGAACTGRPEEGRMRHSTLKYFCCVDEATDNNTTALLEATVRSYAAAHPLNLTFGNVSCNAFDSNHETFDFFALLTEASQSAAAAWVVGLEDTVALATGVPTVKPRSDQTPFHSTILEGCSLDFPVEEALAAARTAISGGAFHGVFQVDPMPLRYAVLTGAPGGDPDIAAAVRIAHSSQ